jgi:hypothetical protein
MAIVKQALPAAMTRIRSAVTRSCVPPAPANAALTYSVTMPKYMISTSLSHSGRGSCAATNAPIDRTSPTSASRWIQPGTPANSSTRRSSK